MNDGEQLELALDKGSWISFSTHCRYVRHEGWNLRVWHTHDGERGLCPSIAHYSGLSTAELAQTLDAVLATVDGRHRVVDGRCSPVI